MVTERIPISNLVATRLTEMTPTIPGGDHVQRTSGPDRRLAWPTVTGAPTISAGTGRRGTAALRLNGGGVLAAKAPAGSVAVTAGTQGNGGIAFVAHIAGFVIGVIAVLVLKKPQAPAELWR